MGSLKRLNEQYYNRRDGIGKADSVTRGWACFSEYRGAVRHKAIVQSVCGVNDP